PGMRQIEGNCKPADSIRRKPFLGQPRMRPERQGASIELPVELFNPLFQLSSVDLYWKIAEPQVEQLPVGQPIKSKPHESIVKSSPVNLVKGLFELKQFSVLAVLFLTGIILWGCEANPAAVPKSNAIPVVVAKVSQKTMPVEVTSVGNVEA